MLAIRFIRIGKKNQPFFRMVVTEKQNPPKGGKFLEILGFFNPKSKETEIKKERVEYWLSVGAQPSDRVHNLLVSNGVIKADKKAVHSKAKKKEGEEEAPKPGETKPAPETKPTDKEAKPEPEAKPAEAVASVKEKTKEGSEKPAQEVKTKEKAEAKPKEKPAEAKKEAKPAEKKEEPKQEEKKKDKPTQEAKPEPEAKPEEPKETK